MGLDMYLTGRKFLWTNWEDPDKNRKEDGKRLKGVDIELGYWRKHPNLHGFIVQTFAKGVDECQDIPLSGDDLVKIMSAVKDKKLPETTGFFFGQSAVEDAAREEEIGQDLTVLTDALAWLQEEVKGESREVIYRASW